MTQKNARFIVAATMLVALGNFALAGDSPPPRNIIGADAVAGIDGRPIDRESEAHTNCWGGCHPSRIYVDDDLTECPDADYVSIQDAVDASDPGDVVIICPGTYNEQVKILHDLTLRGRNAVTLLPSPVLANSTTIGGGDVAAVIAVEGANVKIDNLIVDGGRNQQPGCTPFYAGVYYRNASGEVSNAVIRNMRLGQGLEGCQSGVGLFVQSDADVTSRVRLKGSNIHDYQKGGVVANEPGTILTATYNVVTGDGPTPSNGQNGVQIGFGATGRLINNVVTNHVYAPCVSWWDCPAAAVGILVSDADSTEVRNNTVTRSQVGIWAVGNRNRIKWNNISDNLVYDGIAIEGNGNTVSGNRIASSDESGVYIGGDHNRVIGNRINEAPWGIWIDYGEGTTGLPFNQFFNTEENVVFSYDADGGGSADKSTAARPIPTAVRP